MFFVAIHEPHQLDQQSPASIILVASTSLYQGSEYFGQQIAAANADFAVLKLPVQKNLKQHGTAIQIDLRYRTELKTELSMPYTGLL